VLETNWNPESIALALALAHGSVKVDCVAEWFLAAKVKTITSPTAAVTLVGLNVRVPLPPTVTGISTAETAVATAKRLARAAERRILIKCIVSRK